MSRRLLIPLVLLAFVPAAMRVAAWRGQQPPPPAFRTGVDLVTVDVTVLARSGEPMTTLTADDFEVNVDGRPRRVVSLQLVHAGDTTAPAGAPEATPASTAPAPARRFLIVVDRDHIPNGEGQQMLEAAARFIDALPPGDVAAVWTIPSATSSLRVSTDRDAARKALRLAVGTFRPPITRWMIARDEAMRIDENDKATLETVVGRECYQQPPGCPGEVVAEATVIAADARQRAMITIEALQGLIAAVGPLGGPTHIVLVTGGPVATRSEWPVIASLNSAAASAGVTVDAIQLYDSPARPDFMRATPERVDQSQSLSFLLAGATGGLATTTASGDVGFGQLARELSAGYLLAFESEAADRDGKEHQIAVRVKNAGWGASVRARRTFRIDAARAVAAAAPEPAAPSAAEPPAGPPIDGGADAGDLAGRLEDYADRFQREFAAVVAEERYVQLIRPWRGNPSGPDAEPALVWREPDAPAAAKKGGPIISRRQLLSDILLVQMPNGQWAGYRDVAVVDGRPVRDRAERVQALFLSRSAEGAGQLRRLTEESARYNLGDFRRNLNIPTAALSFMRHVDGWRFAFKRQKDETIDGRPCVVLSYREQARPTLLGTPGGVDVPVEGRVWLEADHGRVVRTELRFQSRGERRASIRVDFGPEPRLQVLVPLRMWEWYEGGDQLGRIGNDKTLVECLATYTNFRRFEVSTTEAVK